MGCTSSRKTENPLEDDLKFYIQECGFEEFDKGFLEAKQILQEIEDMRANLLNIKKQMIKLTWPSYKQDVTILDAVTVFCWSLSASYGGDINSSTFEVLNEPPFFKAELSWLDQEQRQFFILLQGYFKTVIEGPEILKRHKKKLDGLFQELEEKQMSVIRVGNSKNLSPQQVTTLTNVYDRNLSNVGNNKEKVNGFIKFVENERTSLRGSFINQVRAVVRDADKNGKLAAEHHHRTFEKISLNYEMPTRGARGSVFK